MKIIKEEKGFALPLTLVIILALSILGTTLFFISMTETRQVTMTEEKMKAQYIARSGAHAVAEYIISNPDEIDDLSDDSEEVEFGGGTFVVGVKESLEKLIYITSTGQYGDSTQKIVITIDVIKPPLAFKTGSYPGQTGNPIISGGDVYYTESSNMNQEIIIDGELLHKEIVFDEVKLPCNNGCPPPSETYSSGDVISPESGEIGYGNGIDYGNIEIRGNDKLVIDAEALNNDILIKANKIDMGNNDMIVKLGDLNTVTIVVEEFEKAKDITIEGSGYLIFYAKDFTATGNFNLDPNNVTVNIYILEGGELSLSGSPNFRGAIYAPDATVNLDGGGSSSKGGSINGWIVAGIYTGGANTTINYENIELKGNTQYDGVHVISKWNYN